MRCLTAALLILFLTGVAHSQTSNITVIKGATLIDGTGRAPLSNSIIIVDGERIVGAGGQGKIRIPRHARVIDARGKFIIPGLIDCHCHLETVGLGDLGELPPEWNTPEGLRQLILINAKLNLWSGVTTIRDLGSTEAVFKVRREIDSGLQMGPRILAAGRQLVKRTAGAYLDKTFVEYDGADEAREKVRQQAALGAEWIKVRMVHRPARPLPSIEELQAIVDEAHRLGRRVAVHTDVPDDEAVQLAINAGVDTIEHNAPLRAADETILRQMAQKGIALMAGAGGFYVQRFEDQDSNQALDPLTRRLLPPAIVSLLNRITGLLREQTDKLKHSGWDPNQVQARFVRDMQRARKAGVTLIFGTDCGAELMISGQQYKALDGETHMGSTPMEAIIMATKDAARVLGRQKDLGTIEAGKFADLIILDADPLEDLRNLRVIDTVMKSGQLYRPVDSSVHARSPE